MSRGRPAGALDSTLALIAALAAAPFIALGGKAGQLTNTFTVP